MKSPKAWSPEEALQAHQYLIQNPDATDVSAALKAYDDHEAIRAANYRSTAFTPEHRAGGMMGLRTLLPEMLGGIATTHADPSLEDFRKTAKLTPGDDEATAYQDFKDEAWAKAYDDAAAKGLPISRAATPKPLPDTKHMTPDQLSEFLRKSDEADTKETLGGALHVAGGWLPGMDNAIKGATGLVSPNAGKYLEEAESGTSPGEATALSAVGALGPGSLIGKAGKALGGAVGLGEGVLGGLGKGILSGGILGVGSGAVDDATRYAEQAARGDAGSGKDALADSLLAIPGRAAIGGALGAIPGAAGGFARGLRSKATSTGRALNAFEETGGKTSVTAPNGLTLPPTLQELVDKGGPFEHPTDNAINVAKPLLAQGAASRIDETVSPIEAEKEAYHAASDKLGGKALFTPMTRALVKVIRDRSFDSTEGGALPMVRNEPLVAELHKTATSQIMLDHDAQAAERAGGVRVPLDTALSSGIVKPGQELPLARRYIGGTLPPGGDDAAMEQYLHNLSNAGQQEYKAGLPRLAEMLHAPNPMGPVREPTGQPSLPSEFDAEVDRPTTPPGPRSPFGVRPKSPQGLGAIRAGDVDPTGYSVVFTPREGSSRQVDQVIEAVDRAAGMSEAEGAGKADPAYKVLPGAARAMRDQLPPVPGITDKYPEVTITGPDGSPITLTGRSAMAHAHAEQLTGMQRTMKQAGISSDRFDPTDVLQQDKAGQALFGIGPGVGETNRTREVMALAKRTKGGERAIKDVIASRLVNGGELAPKGVGVPSANPERAVAQLAHKYQYKLDPIAQFLGKGAPLAGAASVITDPVTRALLDLAQRTQQGSP